MIFPVCGIAFSGCGPAQCPGHTRLRAGTSSVPTRSRSSSGLRDPSPRKPLLQLRRPSKKRRVRNPDQGPAPNSALRRAFRQDSASFFGGVADALPWRIAPPLSSPSRINYVQSASQPESFILAASSSRVRRAKNSRAWRLINPRRSPNRIQRPRHLPFRKKQ